MAGIWPILGGVGSGITQGIDNFQKQQDRYQALADAAWKRQQVEQELQRQKTASLGAWTAARSGAGQMPQVGGAPAGIPGPQQSPISPSPIAPPGADAPVPYGTPGGPSANFPFGILKSDNGDAGSAPPTAAGGLAGPQQTPSLMPGVRFAPQGRGIPGQVNQMMGGGGVGAGPRADGGIPRFPGVSTMPSSVAVPLINQYESANRNIPNMQGPGGTPASSATGYAQFITSTWKEMASKVGVDTNQYPTAMSAPKQIQDAVTAETYRERGFAPWASNARLMAAAHSITPQQYALLGGNESAAQAAPVANTMLDATPPQFHGMQSLSDIAQKIEATIPDADPETKIMAVKMAQEMLAPDEKRSFEIQMKQWEFMNTAAQKQVLSADERARLSMEQQRLTEEHDWHSAELGRSAATAAREANEPVGEPWQLPDGSFVTRTKGGAVKPLDLPAGAMSPTAAREANEPIGEPWKLPDGSFVTRTKGGGVKPLDLPAGATPVGGRSETPPRYGTVDDLMQKWHADYVAQNKKEPTTDEIAAQRAELSKESKPRGQRVAQLQMRLSIAANEVAKATEAITQLPAGTTLGIFGGAQAKMGEGLVENIKKNLANQVTPQSSQLLASMTNGVTRGLAILEAGGASQGLVGLSTQLQRDLPQASDTGLTIASKYADIRQITEAATEVLMADPDVDKKQIELLQKITDQVRRAIPFTNVDVARLYNADDETIAGFAKRIGLGEASGQAAPAAGGGADHPDQVQGGVLYKWQNGQYQPVQRVQ